jgi:hypothetical protein
VRSSGPVAGPLSRRYLIIFSSRPQPISTCQHRLIHDDTLVGSPGIPIVWSCEQEGPILHSLDMMARLRLLLAFHRLSAWVSGQASRKDLVAMVVLDRSGSMCSINGATAVQPCYKSNTASPCAAMITAAEILVVGLFEISIS